MKEIEISFSIRIPLERIDVNYLEEFLLKEREKVFKEIFLEVLEWIERNIGRPICDCGHGEMVKDGKNPRKVVTLLGKIEFERTRYKCRGCGKESYPLDKAIGLKSEKKYTLGVVERVLWAAVEVSYEKSEEFLKKFTGLEVSRGQIHNLAVEEGQRIEEWESERRRRVFERGEEIEGIEEKSPEVLYIQVDGTGVNDRETKEWMECKVGASFSQKVLISKDRFWLMDKRSYASIEDAESFGEKFFLDCIEQGVLKAKKVFFIGDGARWIRNLKENYFPDAIGVLDIWHLERELKNALGEERRALVEELKGLAFEGKVKEIMKALMREGSREKDPEKVKRIADVMDYIRSNSDWIENIPKVDGYGTGPVEKTVDITVARRFKKRGMSWYKGGANPLLRLRLLKLNGEWDDYWENRKNRLAKYSA